MFNFKRMGLFVMLVVVAMVCFGCASGSISGASKPTVDLGTFRTASVAVDAAGDVTAEETAELKQAITKCLQEDGKWAPVASGDLQINVHIVELSRVSTAARLLVGAFAGKSKCKATVSLTDAKGNVVSSFCVEGQSGGTGWSGGTGTAIDDAGRLVVEYLKTAQK